jgi:D-3-phosphoglycerate dehydrogenase / 2-oxoglutarate reductase
VTPRVLVTEEIAAAGVQMLDDAGMEVDVRTDLDHAALVEVIKDYDGLIVRSATQVSADVIEAGERLRVIGRAGIGVDNVDVDAATRRGVVVVNAPQGNINSTAEHTVGLMLALARQIPQAHASLVSGKWDKKSFKGVELHDKVLGIVGLGRIGTLVAQRCSALGMRIIARDPNLAPQRFGQLGVEQVEMDELLQRSDVITTHVVMTPDTLHMIGKDELARCKPGVLIVNASRGGVIDEDALARALESGHVGGAALDVFETEPVTDSPLFGLPNVVVTPHIAGSTVEAQDKAGTIVAEQVMLALRGEVVTNAVNVQAGADLPDLLKPFVGLTSKLGRLAQALSGEGVSSLDISYHGRIAEYDTRLLTLAALRGFLQPAVLEPVTFVNAPLLASDRGLEYSESRSTSAEDYLNLVRLVISREGEPVSVAGTLAGRANEERLVEIDGRPLEITLTRNMAFFRYEDRPGVVHRASGPLADAQINIKNMVVAEPLHEGEPAIMALAVDSPIPAEVLEGAMQAAGIRSGRFVVLEDE